MPRPKFLIQRERESGGGLEAKIPMAFDGRLLAGVSVLAAVVESGGFAKAADVVGLSASGVRCAVGRLEQRLGIRLFDRMTRSLRLTDEGQQFYAQVSPHLDGIEAAAVIVSDASTSVRGRLRVNVDRYFSRLILAPRLKEFVERSPKRRRVPVPAASRGFKRHHDTKR